MSSVVSRIMSLPIKCRNIAMILHGCGVYDGSEIGESVSILIHLSKQNVNCKMFAPNCVQFQVINHLTGDVMNESRNVLIESARIARGDISPLSKLDAKNFDALLIPGGFGAAKNLSDFALKSANCTVIYEVQSVLKDFHAAGKPIGLCCIAPILAAKCLPGVELTFGGDKEDNGKWPYFSACQAIEEMGAKHVVMAAQEVHVDEKNKVVTTPAYMCGTSTIGNIFDGIGKWIDVVIRM